MKKMKLNIQLFADGAAAGAAATTGANGSGTGTAGTGVAGPDNGREPEKVLYGKQETGSDDNSTAGNVTTNTLEERKAAFENLIRGEYKQEFDERVQKIIRARIGDAKTMQQELDKSRKIAYALSERYGVDANDADKLLAAFNNDKAFYEEEAAKKGVSVDTLMEINNLKAENKAFRDAMETQERQARGEETYNRWLNEAQSLQDKLGIDIDFNMELQNKDFCNMLKSGVTVEGAYMAVHYEDMLTGAMAATAKNVKNQVAKNVAARNARPAEGAISSQPGVTVKSDVHKLTRADREEINRRVARGETITF